MKILHSRNSRRNLNNRYKNRATLSREASSTSSEPETKILCDGETCRKRESIRWRVTIEFQKTVTYVFHPLPGKRSQRNGSNRGQEEIVHQSRSRNASARLAWSTGGESHPLPPSQQKRERQTERERDGIKDCINQRLSVWFPVTRTRGGSTKRRTGSRRRRDTTRILAAVAGWICRWRREMTGKNSCQTIWHRDSCASSPLPLPFIFFSLSRNRHDRDDPSGTFRPLVATCFGCGLGVVWNSPISLGGNWWILLDIGRVWELLVFLVFGNLGLL